jgi:AraC family transcriptional regulator
LQAAQKERISLITSERSVYLPSPLILGEHIVRAGWDTGPRQFEEFVLIWLPTSSQTQYLERDRVIFLNKPCLVLTRPRVPHRYIFDPEQPVRHIAVHFVYEADSQAELPQVLASVVSVLPLRKASSVPRFLRHMVYLAWEKPSRWQRRCSELLSVTLGEIDDLLLAEEERKSGQETIPSAIRQALILMDQHAHEKIRIEQIAYEVGWTHEHFSRIFVKHLGISPQEKLNDIRIEKACQWLVQTGLTVKEIAFNVGFADEAYFCRMFKKARGVTPSHYREQFSDPRVRHLGLTEDDGFDYPLNCMFSLRT